jgi:hypothetical protein
MTRLRLVLLAPLLAALAVSFANAQEWSAPPRDPFATPPALRGAGDPAATWSQSFLAAAPPMAVRGTLRVQGRAPAALLAIGDVVHVVRPGDRLSVVQGTLELPLDVLDVTDRAILVRIGAHDGVLITVR